MLCMFQQEFQYKISAGIHLSNNIGIAKIISMFKQNKNPISVSVATGVVPAPGNLLCFRTKQTVICQYY